LSDVIALQIVGSISELNPPSITADMPSAVSRILAQAEKLDLLQSPQRSAMQKSRSIDNPKKSI
jgi:hypothetical protein